MEHLTTDEILAMAATLEAARSEILAAAGDDDIRRAVDAGGSDALARWAERARASARRTRALERAAAALRLVAELALEDVDAGSEGREARPLAPRCDRRAGGLDDRESADEVGEAAGASGGDAASAAKGGVQ